MAELWYTVKQLPDLTLNKYSSLEGNGVDGVLEKHIAFLRQLNRSGIVSGLSFHLFYLYLSPEDKTKDTPGRRLNIFLLIRGEPDAMRNVPALIKASPLFEFFPFESKTDVEGGKTPVSLDAILASKGIPKPQFSVCSFLTKTETLLPAGVDESDDYYILREWEMNDDGRLYNMCNMMESLNQTALYRVDLYPVERSISLREALRKPMSILRKRQDSRIVGAKRDYDGKDVLDNYEDLIEKYDSSPHFIANIMVFANNREAAVSILDAAGSESLLKGKYNISTFASVFTPESFFSKEIEPLGNLRDRAIMKKGHPGLVVCREDTANINLNYLPTLFSLEEIAPFFRFPALYDGEVIQLPKETAPKSNSANGGLYLGTDDNGYDVYFPLKNLPKHAFIAGVPGSGKTNTMHHLTSTLWKKHHIPFLVFEPAKQEYRALANQKGMEGIYIFSPNADMSFPLHINPFEFPKGLMLAEHIRKLCSVFEGAFPLDNPMPFLLDQAIEAVYRDLGWTPETTYTDKTKLEFPTMSMLYKKLEDELKTTKYSDEIRGNLESALQVRIGSLLRREMGDVFDVPSSTIPPEKWLEIPAIIELESMGTGPANFLTLMLCSLIRETLKVDPKREQTAVRSNSTNSVFSFCIEKPELFHEKEWFNIHCNDLIPNNIEERSDPLVIKSMSGHSSLTLNASNDDTFVFRYADTSFLGYYSVDVENRKLSLFWGNKDVRHVIFIEEAHNLIGPESEEQTGADANPKQAATAFVVKMLAEVRALKEGIVIADQLPTVMAQEVIKNTSLKIGLRITASDDRSLLGSTMAANSLQLEEMATFNVGRSLISYEGLLRPFAMQMHEWCGNWSTPHCQKDILDMAWCKSNCPYYANGDCKPLSSERSKITTSLSDVELVEQMKNRDVYRLICNRSFAIESTKFSREFKKINKQAENNIKHMQTANEIKRDLKNREASISEDIEKRLIEAGVNDDIEQIAEYSSRENSPEMQVIWNNAANATELKLELDTKYLSSDKINRAYSAITDCIALAQRIELRKKHWGRLGINDFGRIEQMAAANANLTQTQIYELGIIQIQQKILMQAQRLFVVAMPHFPKAAELREQLELAAKKLNAKNILR